MYYHWQRNEIINFLKELLKSSQDLEGGDQTSKAGGSTTARVGWVPGPLTRPRPAPAHTPPAAPVPLHRPRPRLLGQPPSAPRPRRTPSRSQVGGRGRGGPLPRPRVPAAAPLLPDQPLCPPRGRHLPARRVCEPLGGGIGGGTGEGRRRSGAGGWVQGWWVAATAHPTTVPPGLRNGAFVACPRVPAKQPPRGGVVPPPWREPSWPSRPGSRCGQRRPRRAERGAGGCAWRENAAKRRGGPEGGAGRGWAGPRRSWAPAPPPLAPAAAAALAARAGWDAWVPGGRPAPGGPGGARRPGPAPRAVRCSDLVGWGEGRTEDREGQILWLLSAELSAGTSAFPAPACGGRPGSPMAPLLEGLPDHLPDNRRSFRPICDGWGSCRLLTFYPRVPQNRIWSWLLGELQLQQSAGRLPLLEADVSGELFLFLLCPHPTPRLQACGFYLPVSWPDLLDGHNTEKGHETNGTLYRAEHPTWNWKREHLRSYLDE